MCFCSKENITIGAVSRLNKLFEQFLFTKSLVRICGQVWVCLLVSFPTPVIQRNSKVLGPRKLFILVVVPKYSKNERLWPRIQIVLSQEIGGLSPKTNVVISAKSESNSEQL